MCISILIVASPQESSLVVVINIFQIRDDSRMRDINGRGQQAASGATTRLVHAKKTQGLAAPSHKPLYEPTQFIQLPRTGIIPGIQQYTTALEKLGVTLFWLDFLHGPEKHVCVY